MHSIILRLHLPAYIAVVLFAMVASCGSMPSSSEERTTATVNVRVWINRQPGAAKVLRKLDTEWDRLILQISGNGMDTIRDTTDIDMSSSYFSITLPDVPSGNSRTIAAWTISPHNDTIHTAESRTMDLTANQTTDVTMILSPTRGSIFLSLVDVPRSVDSVFAVFASDTDTLVTKANRSSSYYYNLSIDYVPHNMSGTLWVYGIDTLAGDTIFEASQALSFDATAPVTVDLQFGAAPSGVAVSLSLLMPGAAVVRGAMMSLTSIGTEMGPLVVSEIMHYPVGDSEYVEIANPTSEIVSMDSIILDVVGSSSPKRIVLHGISIDPGGFFVVGDKKLDQVGDGAFADTSVDLELTNTGRWVVLRDTSGATMDWVAYSDNEHEWPKSQKTYALVLDPITPDPVSNNYGRCWKLATSEIGSSSHYGTPGAPGL